MRISQARILVDHQVEVEGDLRHVTRQTRNDSSGICHLVCIMARENHPIELLNQHARMLLDDKL